MALSQQRLDEIYAIIDDILDQYFPAGDMSKPLKVWVEENIVKSIAEQYPIDADDVDDSTATNKFATQAELDTIASNELRTEVLENLPFKVAYYEEITTTSGQISKPDESTILLDQWGNGVDAVLSKIPGGTGTKPDYEDTGVDVSSFNTDGDYTLSGSLPSNPSALIYYISISLKNFSNLDLDKVVEYAELKFNANVINYSTGIEYPLPTITDNGDGSLTVGEALINLYNNVNYSGEIISYTVSSKTLTLVNDSINYLVVNYNSGSPEYQIITNVDLIEESSIVPIVTAYREDLVIHKLDWDSLGSGLTNKLHKRVVKTDRFARESGLSLSEKNIREIAITSGVLWQGAVEQNLVAFDSDVNNLCFYYHNAGEWVKDNTKTQYINDQYDDGTNLQTLGNNHYVVNWIFRFAADDDSACIVLSDEFDKLIDAQSSDLPELPPAVLSLGLLVGRIIVEKDVDIATQIDSAFDVTFSPSNIIKHNDTTSKQGGNLLNDEFYHLTENDYKNVNVTELIASTNQTLTDTGYNVIVTQSVTISLPDTPSTNRKIKIYSEVDNVVIAGNGNLIVDSTTFTMFKNESIYLIYNNSKWYII